MKQAVVFLIICVCLVFSACASPISADTQVTHTPLQTQTMTPSQSTVPDLIATTPPDESTHPIAADELQTEVMKTIVVKEADTLEKEIIPRLCNVFSLSEQQVKDVLATAKSDLISDSLSGFRRMEGIIIPGSYQINGETLEDYVNIWINQAEQRYAAISAMSTSTNDLKPNEQLALASIVEWECIGDEFEPQATAVFLNRISEGDKLRSCVTVEYALGYQRPYLTSEDIKVKSDYNTYQVRGLPPGPICALDDESLAAAIGKPVDEDLYFFFYDYVQDTMYFFNDYDSFKQAGKESAAKFKDAFDFDKYDIVEKRQVFCNN